VRGDTGRERNGAGRRCADAASHYCNGFMNALPAAKSIAVVENRLDDKQKYFRYFESALIAVGAAQAAVKR
jgi:hypothetical protein